MRNTRNVTQQEQGNNLGPARGNLKARLKEPGGNLKASRRSLFFSPMSFEDHGCPWMPRLCTECGERDCPCRPGEPCTLVTEAAKCLYQLERCRHGRRGMGLVSRDFAREQLARWQFRSAISGETERLRLCRFWPDLDLSDWNCVAVTARENQALGHLSPTARLARFPHQVVERMAHLRRLASEEDSRCT